MEGLAIRLQQDTETWFLAGLLHDIDYDLTFQEPLQHGLKAMDLLAGIALPEDVLHAIRAHGGNVPIESLLDLALWVADPVTGLITASAYMTPERKISAVAITSLKKKFKSKGFAAGASRPQMMECTQLGLELDEYLALALQAMSAHEADLGFA
jgi:predicted hydrolase (HD superfamily)